MATNLLRALGLTLPTHWLNLLETDDYYNPQQLLCKYLDQAWASDKRTFADLGFNEATCVRLNAVADYADVLWTAKKFMRSILLTLTFDPPPDSVQAHQWSQHQVRHTDPDTKHTSDVPVILSGSYGGTDGFGSVPTLLHMRGDTTADGVDLYFHGTCWESAMSIYYFGIDFACLTLTSDFFRERPAFYMSRSFQTASYWARKWFSANRPSVVIFAVPRSQVPTATSIKEYDTPTREWCEHVTVCRSYRVPVNLRHVYTQLQADHYDLVCGPLARCYDGRYEHSAPHFQCAIASDALRDLFHQSKAGVVILFERE